MRRGLVLSFLFFCAITEDWSSATGSRLPASFASRFPQHHECPFGGLQVHRGGVLPGWNTRSLQRRSCGTKLRSMSSRSPGNQHLGAYSEFITGHCMCKRTFDGFRIFLMCHTPSSNNCYTLFTVWCQTTPPRKNTIPNLSKDFNWRQLKSNEHLFLPMNL